MPDLIRHPVPGHHWIAGAETPDLIRGRNDDSAYLPSHQASAIRAPIMTGWCSM